MSAPGGAGRTGVLGWLPWLAMAVVVAVSLGVAASDDGAPVTSSERVYSLSRSIRCPQCAGQSVAESDVVISREIRRDIARRVEAGETDEQIRAAYAARYGDEVLMSPPTSGAGALVWVLPVVALLGGAAVVVALLAQRRRAGGVALSDDDRALVEAALQGDGPGRGGP